jgi:WD40 repeat protein
MLATSAREYSFETADEVILYRVSDGEQLQTLSQHISGVASIAFSPDGRLLATGSNDGIVRLWGIADQP